MRKISFWMAVAGVCLLIFASFFEPQNRLIWNRTDSAPIGLYWVNDTPISPGNWGVVSAKSDAAQWAERQGYVGKAWPLIKQIMAVPGDEICRVDGVISVNGMIMGRAKDIDSRGRSLPVWAGCQVLSETEVFLMNPHPDSLDGRYFGATDLSDLDGVAALIWEF